MTGDPSGVVETRADGRVLTIHIDRREKHNAMTPAMFEQFGDAYHELETNPDLWVGLVTFAGNNMTAGLDLPLFNKAFSKGEVMRSEDRIDPFGLYSRATKPIIMAVQGHVITIGIELLLAADIVIASEDTVMQQLEPKRGLAVLGGANFRMIDRCGWGNAMYHLLRADKISAERALFLGLVQEIVPVGTQRERAREIAEEVASVAPLAAQWIKKSSMASVKASEQPAIDLIAEMMRATSNSEDAREALRSFQSRKTPSFKGR